MKRRSLFVGLDIGGTKIMAASSRGNGQILFRAKALTPQDLQEGLAQIKDLVRDVARNHAILSIGVAIGGPLDWKKGVVSPLHQPQWRKVPLKKILEREFGCPVRVEVDTDAGALGEYRFGKRRFSRLLYVTLSTGMGGGFLINGEIYRGTGGAHPEIAHQAIPYDRKIRQSVHCECGALGCLEALVSGNGIRRVYKKPPEKLSRGEWREVGTHLGLGLRNIAALLAPDAVVFGGGMVSGSGRKFLPLAEKVMRAGLKIVPAPKILQSRLGYDTALMGALVLAQMAKSPK